MAVLNSRLVYLWHLSSGQLFCIMYFHFRIVCYFLIKFEAPHFFSKNTHRWYFVLCPSNQRVHNVSMFSCSQVNLYHLVMVVPVGFLFTKLTIFHFENGKWSQENNLRLCGYPICPESLPFCFNIYWWVLYTVVSIVSLLNVEPTFTNVKWHSFH